MYFKKENDRSFIPFLIRLPQCSQMLCWPDGKPELRLGPVPFFLGIFFLCLHLLFQNLHLSFLAPQFVLYLLKKYNSIFLIFPNFTLSKKPPDNAAVHFTTAHMLINLHFNILQPRHVSKLKSNKCQYLNVKQKLNMAGQEQIQFFFSPNLSLRQAGSPGPSLCSPGSGEGPHKQHMKGAEAHWALQVGKQRLHNLQAKPQGRLMNRPGIANVQRTTQYRETSYHREATLAYN